MALNHDHQELGMFLLHHSEDTLDFTSNECGSYLLTAVRQGHVETANYLLDKGMNIDFSDTYG